MKWLTSFHWEILAQQCFENFEICEPKCSFVNKVKLLASEISIVEVSTFSLRNEEASLTTVSAVVSEKVVTSCLTFATSS